MGILPANKPPAKTKSTKGDPVVRGRVALSSERIALSTLLQLPRETASQYRTVVFRETEDKKTRQKMLALASANPYDPNVQQLVGFLKEKNGVEVELFEATEEDIDAQLARYLAADATMVTGDRTVDMQVTATLAPQKDIETKEALDEVIHSANIPLIATALISHALYKKASDIHIEPLEDTVRVRFRVDGSLVEITSIPRYFRNALISRIKILSQLKIDEQRVPQDGRFDFDYHNHTIDIRVSTFPTVNGEKLVMRLLDKDAGIMTLEQLGVTGSSFDVLVKAIDRPYGVILATGPTGSGKTTTLYALLKRTSRSNINVVTLEDPVEYAMPGLNQSQVKPSIGYTFAEGLRSVLRQDPNVIMVGEIRDLETASMVTHAALTGHLVFTTLHTNDAAGALPRLVDIGVEPYLITSAINAVIAQRLVRKLCVACRQQVQLPQGVVDQVRAELSQLKGFPISNESNFVFYQAVGCSKCTNGYAGRIGIFEILSMSDNIESLVVSKQPSSAIAAQAITEGMITMKQDGILKALKGITTIDEVWRVTSES